ncbi:MAG: class I SAM-dependent methyltransferase [Actinomycetales bacterium]|nr:class I SAM-dependent methyltransferase [Actinomycetales bacterium]
MTALHSGVAPTLPTEHDEAAADAFGERLFDAMLGTFDVLAVAIGDQLDLYRPLVGRWLTSVELAEETRVHERYAREWLEQQCASGILEVADPTRGPRHRQFTLPASHAAVLVPNDTPAYLTPFARVIAAAAVQLPALLEAYRSGGGVPWSDYGPAMRTGQGDANRGLFLTSLAQDWVPRIPGAAAALAAGGAVLDVGCGEGWSTIALALGFPEARVIGVDVDEASVLAAQAHAREHGVGDRVTFRHADAAELAGQDADVVLAFECVHDMPDPVSVLAAMRAAAAPGAPVVVMDERVGEHFSGAADDVERLMYGMSLMICLPDGMSHDDSVGTGTVMRPGTLHGYARAAGFADVEVLDIDNDLFRFYLLRG